MGHIPSLINCSNNDLYNYFSDGPRSKLGSHIAFNCNVFLIEKSYSTFSVLLGLGVFEYIYMYMFI